MHVRPPPTSTLLRCIAAGDCETGLAQTWRRPDVPKGAKRVLRWLARAMGWRPFTNRRTPHERRAQHLLIAQIFKRKSGHRLKCRRSQGRTASGSPTRHRRAGRTVAAGKSDVQEVGATHIAEPERGTRVGRHAGDLDRAKLNIAHMPQIECSAGSGPKPAGSRSSSSRSAGCSAAISVVPPPPCRKVLSLILISSMAWPGMPLRGRQSHDRDPVTHAPPKAFKIYRHGSEASASRSLRRMGRARPSSPCLCR